MDELVAVIGVDPGGTTGVGVITLTEDAFHLEETFQFTDQDTAWVEVQAVVNKYDQLGYEVHLVVERFDKRPGIINPDYSAKFVERDIDNNVDGYYTAFKQIPAEAKNFIKEAKNNQGKGDALKRFGMYEPGKKHARDALRHAITYAVVRLKHHPLILRGWPKPND